MSGHLFAWAFFLTLYNAREHVIGVSVSYQTGIDRPKYTLCCLKKLQP